MSNSEALRTDIVHKLDKLKVYSMFLSDMLDYLSVVFDVIEIHKEKDFPDKSPKLSTFELVRGSEECHFSPIGGDKSEDVEARVEVAHDVSGGNDLDDVELSILSFWNSVLQLRNRGKVISEGEGMELDEEEMVSRLSSSNLQYVIHDQEPISVVSYLLCSKYVSLNFFIQIYSI